MITSGAKINDIELDIRGGNDNFLQSYWETKESMSNKQIQRRLCWEVELINSILCTRHGRAKEAGNIKLPLVEDIFGSIVNEKDMLLLSQKFGDKCRLLIDSVKESEVLITTSDCFWKMISEYKRFFAAYDAIDLESRFDLFASIQCDIQAFVQLRERILERPPEITSFCDRRGTEGDSKKRQKRF